MVYNKKIRHGCDRILVGFSTIDAISTYYHSSCELDYHPWLGVIDRTFFVLGHVVFSG